MPNGESEELPTPSDFEVAPLLDDAVMAFGVFARHRSFTSAAVELSISQPALHAKIKKLQVVLGVKLYETASNRTVGRLTPEGEALELYAKEARRLAVDRVATIRGGHSGPLVVAAGRGGFLYVIPAAMSALSSRPGGLKALAANNDLAIGHVQDGTADVGLIAAIAPPDTLSSEEVGTFGHSLVVRASHPLSSRSHVQVKDLEGIGLALPAATEDLHRNVIAAFHANSVRCTIEAQALDWDLLVKFVEFGIEATIVNDFFPAPAGLVKVPLVDLGSVSYTAIWRPERQAQADEFLKAAKPAT